MTRSKLSSNNLLDSSIIVKALDANDTKPSLLLSDSVADSQALKKQSTLNVSTVVHTALHGNLNSSVHT